MLKDEIRHFLLSVSAGLFAWAISQEIWPSLLALISGFFIDGDHLFDYMLYKRFKGFSLSEFFSGRYFDITGKVILPLHGFEWVAVIFFAIFVFPHQYPVLIALGLGLLFHLLYDAIFNGPIWPTYFFCFRLYHHFDHKVFKFPYHPEGKK